MQLSFLIPSYYILEKELDVIAKSIFNNAVLSPGETRENAKRLFRTRDPLIAIGIFCFRLNGQWNLWSRRNVTETKLILSLYLTRV